MFPPSNSYKNQESLYIIKYVGLINIWINKKNVKVEKKKAIAISIWIEYKIQKLILCKIYKNQMIKMFFLFEILHCNPKLFVKRSNLNSKFE